MAKNRLILFLLLIGLTAFGQPGLGLRTVLVSPRPEPAAMEPTGQVAELLNELRDESPERQPAAAQALLGLGPAFEPQLRGALQHEKPALTFPYVQPQAGYSNILILEPDLLSSHRVEYALEVALSHLQEQHQLEASVVTLHYRDAPLTNVLADFGRQIGAAVEVGSLYLAPLDWIQTNRVMINLDRASYWQAIEELDRAGGLSEIYENLNRLVLVQRGYGYEIPHVRGKEHPVVSGSLQITPVSVEVARALDYANGSNTARMTLTLRAQAEPKLWNSGQRAMVQLDECVDDRGQSLLPDDTGQFASQAEGCYWQWTVPVGFTAPKPGRHVKALKGRFNVSLCVDQRYLTVTNLMHAQGQSREFDGLRFTIRKVEEKYDWNEITFEQSAPAGSPYAKLFTNQADDWNVSIFDGSQHLIYVGRMRGAQMDASVDIWDEFRGYPSRPHPEAACQYGDTRLEAGREVISTVFYFSKHLTPSTMLWLTPPETRWCTVPFELDNPAMP